MSLGASCHNGSFEKKIRKKNDGWRYQFFHAPTPPTTSLTPEPLRRRLSEIIKINKRKKKVEKKIKNIKNID